MLTRCSLVAVLIALLTSGSAAAVTWTEVGDAGKLLDTAQETGTGTLTGIDTDLASATDVDLFRFLVIGQGEVTITTSGEFDTQLFLFDASGLGIAANDDFTDGSGNSLITAELSTGYYYLGVSLFDVDPVSATGLIFPNEQGELLGPTGPGGEDPLSGWVTLGESVDAVVSIEYLFIPTTLLVLGSLESVPAPSSLVLLAAGVGVLVVRRLRSRG